MSATIPSPTSTAAGLTIMGDDHVSVQVDDDTINDDDCSQKLHQILNETGENAIGVIAIEVWTLSPDRTKLVLSKGGFWVDPVYLHTTSSDALNRLIDDSRVDHLPAIPLLPGEGLTGALWSEFSPESTFVSKTKSKIMSSAVKESIAWRDIHLLSIDPDQPYNLRLKALSEAGFGIAAGLPFHKNSVSGMVVFMARKKSHMLDEDYLQCTTDFIGAMLCRQRNTQRVSHDRKELMAAIMRRVRLKLHAIEQFKDIPTKTKPKSLINDTSTGAKDLKYYERQFVDSLRIHTHEVISRAEMWYKKLWGQKMSPPPPLPLSKALFVIIASFIQMFIISGISTLLGIRTNGRFTFRMGTVASFTCMQYTLTSAPAGQPLTGFLATALSCIIALGVKKIPYFTATWIRPAVASSLAIVVMALAGCPHPPAAGTAVSFATNDDYGRDAWILLLSYAIAIVLATAFNNLSETRQYPTFWGNYWLRRITTTCCLKKSKVETDIVEK